MANNRSTLSRQRVGTTAYYDNITGRLSLVDFTRVRMSNSYWFSGTFEWMYSSHRVPFR